MYLVATLPNSLNPVERGPQLPLVQYWHEEGMPGYIADLCQAFERLNPDLCHLVFNESSAKAFIGEQLGERRLRAFCACGVPAMQADYLRYCAVFVLGGAYADIDACCIKGLSSMIPQPGCGQLFMQPGKEGREGLIVNGLFGFGSPRHPFLELALEVATANIECRVSNSVYITTGPVIFTMLYRLHRLGSFAALIDRSGDDSATEFARHLCDAIGDFGLVERAFEGIVISPPADNLWIRSPGRLLPYKRTGAHWMKARGEIFKR